jgi:hypothetical protein
MWSHVKKFKNFEKNPKYSNFYFFFIATNHFENRKLKFIGWLCDFERVFCKNLFFFNAFKLFFKEFF